ncbi:hypothetical protein [Mucilaginibacter dorajii]|uniref:Uncharacterized protein n=1 Tax=Mucilaginibacter dorajii TaxID=692994 RepID=A0ABP7PKS8_9SPHI|nr:hypothetical protein [Mucilaginibacter dorajii]MCS3733610.1 hypothetical protein [Mucilaginibacter dorajii]
MKSIKFIVPAVLLALSINAAKAQTSDVEIGIKAGANVSTLRTGLNAVTDKSGKTALLQAYLPG